MCRLTPLNCPVCKRDDKYAFTPCASFAHTKLATVSGDEDGSGGPKIPPPGERCFCPQLKWPLDPSVDAAVSHNTNTVCDECSEAGRAWYIASMSAELERNRRDNRYARDMCRARGEPDPEPEPLDFGDGGGGGGGGEQADLRKLQKHLPPQFAHLRDAEKRRMLPRWRDTGAEDAEDHIRHRLITLWIPLCRSCEGYKQSTDESARGGFADLEFEPNVITWMLLAKKRTRAASQVRIATGFLHKTCEACIHDEALLRAQVADRIRKLNGSGEAAPPEYRYDAWAIHHWLLCRGVGAFAMNEHAHPNYGLPDRPWPPLAHYLALMAATWERSTGLPWEDIVELRPPTGAFARLPTTLHPAPLLRLDQWSRYVKPHSDKSSCGLREVDPVIRRHLENNPVFGSGGGQGPEAAERAAEVAENHDGEVAEKGEEEVGNSRATTGGKRPAQGAQPPIATEKAKNVRLVKRRIIVERSQTLPTPERKKSKNRKDPKDSPALKLLVSIQGVCIVDGVARHVEDEVAVTPPPSPVRNAAKEVQQDMVESTPIAPTPALRSSLKKRKRTGEDDAAASGPNSKKAKGAEPEPPTPKTTSQSTGPKSVHFPATPEMAEVRKFAVDVDDAEIEGDDLFGDATNNLDLDMADPPEEAAPVLKPGDVKVMQCDQGCLHLIDYYKTRPDEVVHVDVGISYVSEELALQYAWADGGGVEEEETSEEEESDEGGSGSERGDEDDTAASQAQKATTTSSDQESDVSDEDEEEEEL